MSLPQWLPPIQTNYAHSVEVSSLETFSPIRPNTHHGGFDINVHVFITYVCNNQNVSRSQLLGLSLIGEFNIGYDDTGISPSMLTESRQTITNMLAYIPVPFSLDRFTWRASRLGGLMSTGMLNDDDIESCVLRYIEAMKESSNNSQNQNVEQSFVLELSINKKVFVPQDEFMTWIRWYDFENTRSPGFKDGYLEAISRPWCYDEPFYEALNKRCIKDALNNLMIEDEFSGSNPQKICTICQEEFGRVLHMARLPCGHLFHRACIAEWLSYDKKTCPLCRKNFYISLFLGPYKHNFYDDD